MRTTRRPQPPRPAPTRLLRLDDARKRSEPVRAWLDSRPEPLQSIARHWFDRKRACGDDVLELMHDGCPTVCVEDAGFAYVGCFRAHVNVGFLRGATLDDPAGLLEGAGKLGRHVKIRPEEPKDATALERLLEAAYLEIKARLREEC